MDCQPSLQEKASEKPESSGELTLAQLIGRADLWLKKKLLKALEQGNHQGLSQADVLMLANLNCGRTYPSEVARRIGVTRQAVYKMLKNLKQQGIISLEPDTERLNSKVIVITPKGETLIREAVEILKDIENELRALLPPESVDQLRAILEQNWGDP
ncbi:MAG: MarR family winged helix-turn-helix transcriptional regulator [Verrucomicrobiota bacterium]